MKQGQTVDVLDRTVWYNYRQTLVGFMGSLILEFWLKRFLGFLQGVSFLSSFGFPRQANEIE